MKNRRGMESIPFGEHQEWREERRKGQNETAQTEKETGKGVSLRQLWSSVCMFHIYVPSF